MMQTKTFEVITNGPTMGRTVDMVQARSAKAACLAIATSTVFAVEGSRIGRIIDRTHYVRVLCNGFYVETVK